MGFGADLKRIAEKRNLDLREISRTVPLRIFNAVLRDTRVDTGRMRGNFQVTTAIPAVTVLERKDPNKGGDLMASEASKVMPFSLTYLTNNLVYAPVWEEKDAMIGRAIADFQRIVREEAAAL